MRVTSRQTQINSLWNDCIQKDDGSEHWAQNKCVNLERTVTGAEIDGNRTKPQTETFWTYCSCARFDHTHILHCAIGSKRSRGRLRRRCMDDSKEWTGLPTAACVTDTDGESWLSRQQPPTFRHEDETSERISNTYETVLWLTQQKRTLRTNRTNLTAYRYNTLLLLMLYDYRVYCHCHLFIHSSVVTRPLSISIHVEYHIQ